MSGYDINWSSPSAQIKTNPLYLKYSNTVIEELTDQLGAIQGAMSQLRPSAENAEIISYYSWLIRVIGLLS